jgi:hypothetical protein
MFVFGVPQKDLRHRAHQECDFSFVTSSDIATSMWRSPQQEGLNRVYFSSALL